MTTFSRQRKKRIRSFNTRLKWNNGPSRVLDNWLIIDIHDTTFPGYEFDFWCTNKKDIYLFRIAKSLNTKFHISKSKGTGQYIYLIAETDFETVSNELLYKTLNLFEQKGIPRAEQKKIKISY